jgi:hypothetical protein
LVNAQTRSAQACSHANIKPMILPAYQIIN